MNVEDFDKLTVFQSPITLMNWLRSRKVLSLWRPEPMELVQLWLSSDSAHDIIKTLGEKTIIEMRDLNEGLNSFQRHFVRYEKKCEAMERILRYLASQVEICEKEDGHEIAYSFDKNVDAALFDDDEPKTLTDMEENLEKIESDVLELMEQRKKLLENKLQFEEVMEVLNRAHFFYKGEAKVSVEKRPEEQLELSETPAPGAEGEDVEQGAEVYPKLEKENPSLQSGTYEPILKIINIAGVVPYKRYQAFERVIWRMTRGNIFIRKAEIEKDGDGNHRVVFAVFFSGESTKAKILKICNAFNVHIYPCPESEEERDTLKNEVLVRLMDVEVVLASNRTQLDEILSRVSVNFTEWVKMVRTEKLIYGELNKCNVNTSSHAIIAEGWVQKTRVKELEDIVVGASAEESSMVNMISEHNFTPPTYFETNKYTEPFLGIVHAYGVANYREVSPVPFTIITFPFLFAVMFGDAGHGSLMTLFAFFLIFRENKYEGKVLNEFMQFAYDGRYPLLLMGLFSTYVGLCYNETFSLSFDLFGTNYYYPNGSTFDTGAAWTISPNWVYPFGVDPAWKGTEAELLYYNSLKMKLSVILGVTQMILGVFLSLVNYIYKLSILDIVTVFIPEIIFIHSIFGYLVFGIFYKWSLEWIPGQNDSRLLNTIIFMFLSPFKADPELYPFQVYVQNVLVILAIVSVPWLLLGKPSVIIGIRLYRKIKKMIADKSGGVYNKLDEDEGEEGVVAEELDPEKLSSEDKEEEEESIVEIFLEQFIHTLEYVIGCVSNTASYLRLWALSLAHTELSTVFYERILVTTLSLGTTFFPLLFFVPFFGFIVWAGATFAILLCMETLSAMLHALRLHWVEFQNKFYHGEGIAYDPFNLEELLPREHEP